MSGVESAKCTPAVTSSAFTFTVTGDCIYCGKSVSRQRTVHAPSTDDARALVANVKIWHRKCGLR